MYSTLPSLCGKVTGILSLYIHFTDKKTEVQRKEIVSPVILEQLVRELCG